jgi:gamma-glutamyl:cysteine ligase YbdK (ATP-grasp superfamily)
MNLFDPRTFSTDWEILVVDKLERCVGSEKLALQSEFDLPIQVDWNSLEFALGINTSFGQMLERVMALTDSASQMLREYDLDVFPCGSHPLDFMLSSSHIHVGTIHDEVGGIWLENRLMKYAPVFAALAANSPAHAGLRGECKSYRVRELAHGCARPADCRNPGISQPAWGSDAGPKVYSAPTMEVRIPDCASSRRLATELAVFVAAYVHHRGTDVGEYTPSCEEYVDYLTNRWSAAAHGLQATFRWDGAARPVVEIIDDMLDECREELAVLGAARGDLVIAGKMIEKRTCQADFLISLFDRYPDDYCLASACGKLLRHWDIFEEFIENAPALDPIPLVSEETVMDEHLAVVGEGTHFYRVRDVMQYPPTASDALIERMLDQHLIEREIRDSGIFLRRTGRVGN